MLFNEPKLLKCWGFGVERRLGIGFSALQRAEIAEMSISSAARCSSSGVSVLFNEPKLLKCIAATSRALVSIVVSVLFNEPKLLKFTNLYKTLAALYVSVLFNEPKLLKSYGNVQVYNDLDGFSALQRAEIAEIPAHHHPRHRPETVSVLFNEPKLLKSMASLARSTLMIVSVLFNEPKLLKLR